MGQVIIMKEGLHEEEEQVPTMCNRNGGIYVDNEEVVNVSRGDELRGKYCESKIKENIKC